VKPRVQTLVSPPPKKNQKEKMIRINPGSKIRYLLDGNDSAGRLKSQSFWKTLEALSGAEDLKIAPSDPALPLENSSLLRSETKQISKLPMMST
jgi:hypothetical protein